MKASIRPLEGKYYGTIVDIEDVGIIEVWLNTGADKPSVREIEYYGYTKEQYDNNEIVDAVWLGKCTVHEAMDICDSHYENETSYKIAQIIVDAINKV